VRACVHRGVRALVYVNVSVSNWVLQKKKQYSCLLTGMWPNKYLMKIILMRGLCVMIARLRDK
jgi:hypothetical protein